MLTSSPHVRLAILGENLVILDIEADRYQALPGAVVPEGQGPALAGSGVGIAPEAADLLIESGLLMAGDDASSLPQRPGSSLKPVKASSSLSDIARLLAALPLTGWRLARHRHCRSFDEERLPPFEPSEEERCMKAMASLSRLRLLVPTPTRCLPAALVTCAFLKWRGIEAEIVFGVRGHPFEAHCWVERGGKVLDDDLDRVLAYTPIAIGRL